MTYPVNDDDDDDDDEKNNHDNNNEQYTYSIGDTRCCSWLRPCATSRKVAGSIPDGVIKIFH